MQSIRVPVLSKNEYPDNSIWVSQLMSAPLAKEAGGGFGVPPGLLPPDEDPPFFEQPVNKTIPANRQNGNNPLLRVKRREPEMRNLPCLKNLCNRLRNFSKKIIFSFLDFPASCNNYFLFAEDSR
jgi:hypothetical protein